MRIIRVLNTNAVLSKDRDKNEVILLGAGIGFKQRPGGKIDESKIEKQFVMKDPKQLSRFKNLVNDIPQEYILTAEAIIDEAKNGNFLKLNESIHISLADHIHTSVENIKQGISIPNTLLLDIKNFYPTEYSIALRGLDTIENRLGYRLSEDEAGYIAMHFVNAEYGTENTNVKSIISFVSEINDFILNDLNIIPNENSLNFHRYMTHLKFFAKRVMENQQYNDQNDPLLSVLMEKYKREYECSIKTAVYIKDHYNYSIGTDEILYLTVHLAHITRDGQ